jgi:Putative peptidoglycan binding domain/LysM domain
MTTPYKVKAGDCLSSIAYEQGFFPDTLWNHPDNSELKQNRKDPNVLMPGDVVSIPDKALKEASKPAGQKHRFKKKGVPAKLKVCLMKKGKPRKNEKFRLIIDGIPVEGTTDGKGFVEKPLPPNARQGKLIVGEGANKEVYLLQFGQVDPIDTDTGVAGRLQNLGYSVGEDLAGALRKFQANNKLEVTGTINDATRNKLKENFGQ